MKLREGNVFTGVCVSTVGGGGHIPWDHTPRSVHPVTVPPGNHNPLLLTPSDSHHTYSWQADGTHPTGMYSCFNYNCHKYIPYMLLLWNFLDNQIFKRI